MATEAHSKHGQEPAPAAGQAGGRERPSARDLERKSSAVTLSDMEVFIFPELMLSLVLANIMSPRIWKWREDRWFDGIEGMTPYRRITRLKQYIMDHYAFNLDLDTWGLTTKQTEIARFNDYVSPEALATVERPLRLRGRQVLLRHRHPHSLRPRQVRGRHHPVLEDRDRRGYGRVLPQARLLDRGRRVRLAGGPLCGGHVHRRNGPPARYLPDGYASSLSELRGYRPGHPHQQSPSGDQEHVVQRDRPLCPGPARPGERTGHRGSSRDGLDPHPVLGGDHRAGRLLALRRASCASSCRARSPRNCSATSSATAPTCRNASRPAGATSAWTTTSRWRSCSPTRETSRTASTTTRASGLFMEVAGEDFAPHMLPNRIVIDDLEQLVKQQRVDIRTPQGFSLLVEQVGRSCPGAQDAIERLRSFCWTEPRLPRSCHQDVRPRSDPAPDRGGDGPCGDHRPP